MLNLNVNILHKFVLIVWGKLSLILQYAMVDLTRDRSLRDQELLWMVFREKQSGLFFLNIGRFKMLWNKRSSQ